MTQVSSSIAVAPPVFSTNIRKDKSAEAKLIKQLDYDYKYTQVMAIRRPEDVLMSREARVQGRYRFTFQALTQICNRMAKGLASTLPDIAGPEGYESDELRDALMCNVPLAVSWYNACVKLRFRRLEGHMLIVNRDAHRIDGLVGRKYEYMPNRDLFERARRFTKQADRPAFMTEASVEGRRMIARFVEKTPLFSLTTPQGQQELFYAGYHFGNSETGDCAIKATPLIHRRLSGGNAIGTFKDGHKITHVRGPRFEQRFAQLLGKVADGRDKLQENNDVVCRLRRARLGFGVDFKKHTARIKAVTLRLRKQGLTADFAKSVVQQLLTYGSYRSERASASLDPMPTYVRRNAFDLFNALQMKAKTCSIDCREKAEQLAYRMLTEEKPIV